MNWPSKNEVEEIRRKYPPGTKIKIIKMDDPTPVPPGTIGTIRSVDDAGQIHCNEFSLAVIPRKDKFEVEKISKQRYVELRDHGEKTYTVIDRQGQLFEEELLSFEEVVTRLNEQNETIQSLKKELWNCEEDYILEEYL